MIRLVIKGNVAQAWEAGKARGIPIRNPKPINQYEVAAEVADFRHEDVMQWFCEDVSPIEGVGYPVGTLLLHS